MEIRGEGAEPGAPGTGLLISDTIDEQTRALIGGGLDAYNDEIVGHGDRKPLAVLITDPVTGKVCGGALGRSSLGLLFLDLFYIPKAMRGARLGTRVLQAFEEEGRRRGCLSAVLYTLSFQAPKFYERNGWRVFGELPCFPHGESRVFLSKDLKQVNSIE